MADKFCDPTASGADDGSSWTDAWETLQKAADNAVAGDHVFCKAGGGTDETPAATIDFDTHSGSIAGGYIKFIGVNGDESVDPNDDNDGTRYKVSGASLAGGNAIFSISGQDYLWFENFEVFGATGAGGHGVSLNTDNCDGLFFSNVLSHDNGGCGFNVIYGRADNLYFLCQAYDNGQDGWGNPYYDPALILCRAHDNGGFGVEGGSYPGGNIRIGCIADSNGYDGFECDEYMIMWECISAWNDVNVKITGGGPAFLFGLRCTHQDLGDGLEIAADKLCTLSHAYFGGNSTDISGSYEALKVLGDARITLNGSDTNHGYTDDTEAAPDFNLRSDATLRNQAIVISPSPT